MRLRIETLILEIHPDHTWLMLLAGIGIGVFIGAWLVLQRIPMGRMKKTPQVSVAPKGREFKSQQRNRYC